MNSKGEWISVIRQRRCRRQPPATQPTEMNAEKRMKQQQTERIERQRFVYDGIRRAYHFIGPFICDGRWVDGGTGDGEGANGVLARLCNFAAINYSRK